MMNIETKYWKYYPSEYSPYIRCKEINYSMTISHIQMLLSCYERPNRMVSEFAEMIIEEYPPRYWSVDYAEFELIMAELLDIVYSLQSSDEKEIIGEQQWQM